MRLLRPPALLPLTLASLIALGAPGCGEEDEETPVACREGAATYLAALESAPRRALLDGEVPISDCFAEDQGGGRLEEVGAATIDAATQLNREARGDPGGAANLELGYLVGAAERGAEDTSGIHAELVRRLTAAALYSPGGGGLPARFLETYRRGVEAGRRQG